MLKATSCSCPGNLHAYDSQLNLKHDEDTRCQAHAQFNIRHGCFIFIPFKLFNINLIRSVELFFSNLPLARSGTK